MLTFDEALALVASLGAPLGAERVGLDDADGRVLAEDVRAPFPLPRFDHSAMDGYAVATRSLASSGDTELPIEGESAAGSVPGALAPGSTCRIFTGAPLPRGADAVVMQEDVERGEREGQAVARFAIRPAVGAHVRRAGDDLAEGAVALGAGTRLGPGQVALAAALDRATLLVGRRPVVTILGTGNELRAPGEPDRPGSIVESNGTFVALWARRAGAIARQAPHVGDDAGEARRAIERALAGTDVLVTIGGVSVGDHDVVRPALEAAGVTISAYKVAMKPGKPLTIGRRGGTIVLGLPGNPASASLTFLVFGVPLLRALAGDAAAWPVRTRLPLAAPVRRKAGRTELLRATLDPAGTVRPLAGQASGAVTSFAAATALVIVPAEVAELEAGASVEVLRLADLG